MKNTSVKKVYTNMESIGGHTTQLEIIMDCIINNPESKMRIGIKEVDEFVSKETKNRILNAPLSAEEKAFLSI